MHWQDIITSRICPIQHSIGTQPSNIPTLIDLKKVSQPFETCLTAQATQATQAIQAAEEEVVVVAVEAGVKEAKATTVLMEPMAHPAGVPLTQEGQEILGVLQAEVVGAVEEVGAVKNEEARIKKYQVRAYFRFLHPRYVLTVGTNSGPATCSLGLTYSSPMGHQVVFPRYVEYHEHFPYFKVYYPCVVFHLLHV